jgi:hypothetical protein
MAEIHCYIPIRIRIIGLPDDDQLDQLTGAVQRAVAQRIALADRTVRATAAGGHLLSGTTAGGGHPVSGSAEVQMTAAAFSRAHVAAPPPAPGRAVTPGHLMGLQHDVGLGNTASRQAIGATSGAPGKAPSGLDAAWAAVAERVRFIWSAGPSGAEMHAQPEDWSPVLARVKELQRVLVAPGAEQLPSGWVKIVYGRTTGYVDKKYLHPPPPDLIRRDPGLRMIKTRKDESLWELVHEVYGIRGDESTPDLNINHFINAIRAVNKASPFMPDPRGGPGIGSPLELVRSTMPGYDASRTWLRRDNYLWIPSLDVAAAMHVGSGTIRGEISGLARAVAQKLEDFHLACDAADRFIRPALLKYGGAAASELLPGLLQFAKEAAEILAVSTAVGTILGAVLTAGPGAVPGAEVGFEIGLLMLEYYGMYEMIKSIAGVLVEVGSRLADFVRLVWDANGRSEQIDAAGMALADAFGMIAAAALAALVSYVAHHGVKALGRTRFGQIVGESSVMRWLKERQATVSGRDQLPGGERQQPETGEPGTGAREQSAAPKSAPVPADPERLAAETDTTTQGGRPAPDVAVDSPESPKKPQKTGPAPVRAAAHDEPTTTAPSTKQLPAKSSASDRSGSAEPAAADPVTKQEDVVRRRQENVIDATRAVHEADSRVGRTETDAATARRRYADAQAEAERAQKAGEQAQLDAAGAKRGSDPAKRATQARNDAKKAAKGGVKAKKALDRAEGEFRDARKAQSKATARAKSARDDLKRSRAELERRRTGESTWKPPLKVVRDPRTVKSPSGGKLIDRGYEGRRTDDPPRGMERNRVFDQSDPNLQRMLDGRPPIGRDGEPVNLHHRTRGPMSKLDEYSATEHRDLPLHEPDLDSQIDRDLFGEQRARYWVTRARRLLGLE